MAQGEQSLTVSRFESGQRTVFGDRVASEEPLEIRAGARPLAVTMRTPGNDFELAAGFLLAEGIVRSPAEIAHLAHCADEAGTASSENIVLVTLAGDAAFALGPRPPLRLTTSSCGLCSKSSIADVHRRFGPITDGFLLPSSFLVSLPDRIRDGQTVFASTGGLHAAALFDRKGVEPVIREDVGRHNAVDKVIGRALLDGRLPLSDSVLLVSGRASFEIVQKALAARIPAVAAVSAPSSLAVELASESNMILVGFLRGQSFNVYAGAEKVSDG